MSLWWGLHAQHEKLWCRECSNTVTEVYMFLYVESFRNTVIKFWKRNGSASPWERRRDQIDRKFNTSASPSVHNVSPLSGPTTSFTVATRFLHEFCRPRSWSQPGPSEAIKFLKFFTVHAIDPNFILVMVGGSNDGRRTRRFHLSVHSRAQPLTLV